MIKMKKVYLKISLLAFILVVPLCLTAQNSSTISSASGGLTIGRGDSLRLGEGCALTISGNLKNEGNFTIASNASGSGSLIIKGNVSGNGTFICQHYIPGEDGRDIVSSPSKKDTLGGSDIIQSSSSGMPPANFDFYSFDQSLSSQYWINKLPSDKTVKSGVEHNFIPGKGYLVAYSSANGKATLNFKGPFNSGDITAPALDYKSGATWAGLNLIGNPYTSAIDWGKANHSAFADNFAYVYDPDKAGGAGYVDVDGSTTGAYLAPGQAFFVDVTAPGSFTFTPSMQLHHTTTTLKSTNATQSNSDIVLRLSSDNYYDETTIRVMYGTKSARDRDDALELPSLDDSVPQLFSYTSDSVSVAINTYPALDSIEEVQLGTMMPSDGSYTISLQSRTGAFAGKPAVLKDLSNGTTTDLTQGSYTFYGKKSDTKRFILILQKIKGVTNQISNTGILLYSYKREIYIQSRDNSLISAAVKVYNMMGQLVYQTRVSETSKAVLNPMVQQGIYVVRMQRKNGQVITKELAISR